MINSIYYLFLVSNTLSCDLESAIELLEDECIKNYILNELNGFKNRNEKIVFIRYAALYLNAYYQKEIENSYNDYINQTINLE